MNSNDIKANEIRPQWLQIIDDINVKVIKWATWNLETHKVPRAFLENRLRKFRHWHNGCLCVSVYIYEKNFVTWLYWLQVSQGTVANNGQNENRVAQFYCYILQSINSPTLLAKVRRLTTSDNAHIPW